ncbi:MAG: hypothetical protein D6767_06955 [Candidatus Hydrogenedentota bacterium]|nr:MAG: hypothetical protein D6767_06955 [Candidatus Hydrogenedentota bacterium]
MADEVYCGYRIKLIVSIEKNGKFTSRNEILVPSFYRYLDEARADIEEDIRHRLRTSYYFRSQRVGYDLVRYSREASLNTYMAYRIIPIKQKEKVESS